MLLGHVVSLLKLHPFPSRNTFFASEARRSSFLETELRLVGAGFIVSLHNTCQEHPFSGVEGGAEKRLHLRVGRQRHAHLDRCLPWEWEGTGPAGALLLGAEVSE